MNINLNIIDEKGISLDQEIVFEESYYKDTFIKGLKNVYIKGKIYYSTTREVILSAKLSGIMIINDSMTNELVDYPFNSDIEEILAESNEYEENLRTNKQNSLDLKEVLWQNIVLEVPITFTLNSDALLSKGEGWELKDENSRKDDPRLDALRALLEENGKE